MIRTLTHALHAPILRLGLTVILLSLGGGCAGYHVGGTPPPGVRSVYVPTFVNQCGEPQIEFDTTRATIQEFQKDGNLWIRSEDQADAVLKVTLLNYTLDPLRYDQNSGKSAREYRVTITVQCSLESRKTGASLLNRKLSGDATFQFAGDLTSARTRALPLVAQDLAQNIVDSVVSYW